MKDNIFRNVVLGILACGIISVIVLLIITIFLYNQVSIITFIEKEIW